MALVLFGGPEIFNVTEVVEIPTLPTLTAMELWEPRVTDSESDDGMVKSTPTFSVKVCVAFGVIPFIAVINGERRTTIIGF